MYLPEEFKVLEPFAAEWSLPTESERKEKRAGSSFSDLQSYYDAVSPRMPDIAAHLDQFPVRGLAEDQQRLLNLALMFMEVSIAVEFYGQSELPQGFPRERFVISDL